MFNDDNSNPLATKIEKIIDLTDDALDPDLLSHVDRYLSNLGRMAPLPTFDLLTPESARKSLAVIKTKHEELIGKLRIAQALKDMLLSARQKCINALDT